MLEQPRESILNNEVRINVEAPSPKIVYLDNNNIKVTITPDAQDDSTDILIELKEKKWKQKFNNSQFHESSLQTIAEIGRNISDKELYNLNYRAEFIDIWEANRKHINTFITKVLISLSSATASLILMSKGGGLSLPNTGDGIWSADQASDGVGITARALNAIWPLITHIFAVVVEENKYYWEKNTYKKLQQCVLIGDIFGCIATMGETYAFNRGNLETDEVYDLTALSKADNLKKVFGNDYSSIFTVEQIFRLFTDFGQMINVEFELISEKANSIIKEIIKLLQAAMVFGGFANVGVGIHFGSNGNIGHGVEALPNNDQYKNLTGVGFAAGGSIYEIIKTVKEKSTAGINWIKNKLFTQQVAPINQTLTINSNETNENTPLFSPYNQQTNYKTTEVSQSQIISTPNISLLHSAENQSFSSHTRQNNYDANNDSYISFEESPNYQYHEKPNYTINNLEKSNQAYEQLAVNQKIIADNNSFVSFENSPTSEDEKKIDATSNGIFKHQNENNSHVNTSVRTELSF